MGCKLPAAIWPVVLGACAGVAPDPAAMAGDLPASGAPTPAEREEAERRAAAAVNLLDLRRFPAAESAARRALDLDPRSARARAVLGAALMEQARAEVTPDLDVWRTAEGELLRAAALAPDDPLVHVLHGRFLAADGHYSAAAEAAERAVALDPGDADARAQAATWRYELGEERAALPHLEALMALRPDDVLARYRAGMCRLRLAGRPGDEGRRAALQAAAGDFAAYREVVPDDPAGYLAEAHALVLLHAVTGPEQGRAELGDRVRRVLAEGAARYPRRAEFSYLEGLIAEQEGNIEGARTAYRLALEEEPDHGGALLNLSRLLIASDDAGEAVPLLRRLLEAGVAGAGLDPIERDRVRRALAELQQDR